MLKKYNNIMQIKTNFQNKKKKKIETNHLMHAAYSIQSKEVLLIGPLVNLDGAHYNHRTVLCKLTLYKRWLKVQFTEIKMNEFTFIGYNLNFKYIK